MKEEKRQEFLKKNQEHGWPFLLVLEENSPDRECGLLYQFHTSCATRFSSLSEAVLAMERRMEEQGRPESQAALRTFSEKTPAAKAGGRRKEAGCPEKGICWEPASFVLKPKSRGVFYITVFYRQNSSWQGEAVWKEGKEKRYFRSVLELLNLLDSVCPKRGAADEEKPEREA